MSGCPDASHAALFPAGKLALVRASLADPLAPSNTDSCEARRQRPSMLRVKQGEGPSQGIPDSAMSEVSYSRFFSAAARRPARFQTVHMSRQIACGEHRSADEFHSTLADMFSCGVMHTHTHIYIYI